jgi:hypothetical protein
MKGNYAASQATGVKAGIRDGGALGTLNISMPTTDYQSKMAKIQDKFS